MKGYRRANFLLYLFYTLNTVKQCTGCFFERNGREQNWGWDGTEYSELEQWMITQMTSTF